MFENSYTGDALYTVNFLSARTHSMIKIATNQQNIVFQAYEPLGWKSGQSEKLIYIYIYIYMIVCTLVAGCQPHNIQTMCFNVWCCTWCSPCVYLSKLCTRCIDLRLWPSTGDNFVARRTSTHFEDSSVAVTRPTALNSLPAYIHNIDSHSAFCCHLKTYLLSAFNWLNCDICFPFDHFFWLVTHDLVAPSSEHKCMNLSNVILII